MYVFRSDRKRGGEEKSGERTCPLDAGREREARSAHACVYNAGGKVPGIIYRRNEFVNEAGRSGASVCPARRVGENAREREQRI